MVTIGIDPTIELGPVTLAWHGITIALGLLVGGALAAREARRRRLDTEPLSTIGILIAVSALVGGRLFYLAEHGDLLRPAAWLGTQGFAFNGGFILATAAVTLYVWRRRLDLAYLGVVVAALPLGVLVGRIGDVINGEHYGPPTDSLLGVRNTHPDASVPSPDVAYHSGGLYEMLLAAAVLAVVWPLRDRLRTPVAMVWLVPGLFSFGRFFEFFLRSDSEQVASRTQLGAVDEPRARRRGGARRNRHDSASAPRVSSGLRESAPWARRTPPGVEWNSFTRRSAGTGFV